jgi:pimeloyl-ACP methyl ester carboxylesterase
LTVVRTDLSSVGVRPQASRNPTDSDVTIPANGFSIAGTLTVPREVGRLRHPAVVLVAGSGAVDRDETVAGIPIFTQLAGALAERGVLVLRYDKRGVGQSGGRTETATLQDYATDLIAVVKWLAKRDDVDPRRIAVAGHSEGGAVGMLAAGREQKIASLVLIASPGTTGAELILRQQQHQLDVMKATAADREEKVKLQKQIQQAVVSGTGWEGVPENLRKQADTPWFRSMLLFDPAREMARIKQPILIIQGDLDTQIFPDHADRLGELARGRKKASPVEVVHLPGVNHLLVPATSGEVQEYATLKDKTVSPEVALRIADWLKK